MMKEDLKATILSAKWKETDNSIVQGKEALDAIVDILWPHIEKAIREANRDGYRTGMATRQAEQKRDGFNAGLDKAKDVIDKFLVEHDMGHITLFAHLFQDIEGAKHD